MSYPSAHRIWFSNSYSTSASKLFPANSHDAAYLDTFGPYSEYAAAYLTLQGCGQAISPVGFVRFTPVAAKSADEETSCRDATVSCNGDTFHTRESPGRISATALLCVRCSGFRSICCDKFCCAACHKTHNSASVCCV